jgi:sigma-B regulation protein RsbU (phosphoserine phosphatase)
VTDDPFRLFELAPAAYVVFDRDGAILQANLAFLRLVSRDRDDVVGRRTLTSLFTVGGRIFFETHLMPLLELNGRVDEVALEVLAADGSRVPVLLSANLDRSAGESIVRAILFEARDRRRYETDLLRTTRAAEQSERHANDLSRTLQQVLIPPVPPIIPGLEVSGAYRPAGDGREVGGDFYDVFHVGGNAWLVVLGDVAGKGIPAATVTAFIRHTIRALGAQVVEPAQILRQLDRALNEHDTDRFCTAVVLRLEDTDAGWVVSGSLGGHPHPLLGRTDGSVTELGERGSLIGVLDDPEFSLFTLTLAPDEFIVLFTDGVTEARQGRDQYGDERLRELVRTHAADPTALTEHIVQAALDFQHGNANDDIAILTLYPTRRP